MAPISYNLLGWLHQEGLSRLRDSYLSAMDGIGLRIKAAYDDIDQHDKEVAETNNDQIERDDDGNVIVDPRDILLYSAEIAEETESDLNKAFAIAIFHYWERSARSWTKKHSGKFTTLVHDVEAIGYSVDGELKNLHLVVNLLKHANSKHANLLMQESSKYLKEDNYNDAISHEWYDEVLLNKKDILNFFKIAEMSGPTLSEN